MSGGPARGRENALGQFLRARREQVTPESSGIPDLGRRRVPGLRREELALLAGVSSDYYTRLEQGRDLHPSDEVLDALARALRLEEAATAHLHQLGRPRTRPHRRRRPESVDHGIVELMHTWALTPAFVLGRRTDVLTANPLAGALWGGFRSGGNLLRTVFLDAGATTTVNDWHQIAADAVASLRSSAGSDLDDPQLTTLVGELSLKNEDFRGLWARHDVRGKADGIKSFHHPLVGTLTLAYNSLRLPEPGQTLVALHAKFHSPDDQALRLLESLVTAETSTTAPDTSEAQDSTDRR